MSKISEKKGSVVPLLVGLLFSFFLLAQATATPTTVKIISAARTPAISGKLPVSKLKDV